MSSTYQRLNNCTQTNEDQKQEPEQIEEFTNEVSYSLLQDSPPPRRQCCTDSTDTPTKGHRLRQCLFGTFVTISLLVASYYIFVPIIVTHILSKTNISFVDVSMDDLVHRADRPPAAAVADSPTQQHNPYLTLQAHCQLHGMALPFDIGIIAPSLNVYHGHQRLGHLVPINPETTVHKRNNGSFSLLASLMIDNMTSFHNFAGRLLEENTVQWRLVDPHGISIRLDVPFFSTSIALYVPNVHLNKSIVMKGCGGFKNTSLEVFYLDDFPSNATGGKAPGLNVHMTARVFNPSTANVSDMGRIHFDMSYTVPGGSNESSVTGERGVVGVVNGNAAPPQIIQLGYLETDESLSVAPGWNTLRGTGRFNAQGELANGLIHNFMMGLPTNLRATAPMANASTDPLFSEFVGGLSLDTTLAGTPKGLVHKGQWLLSEKLILEFLTCHGCVLAVPFVSELKNPFGAVVYIESSDFDVIYENITVGTVHHENMTTVIPRNGSSWTNPVNIMVDLKIPGMSAITNKIVERMLEDGDVMLSIRGNFTFTSGGLHFAPKNYEQYDNVPCCIGWPHKGTDYQNRTCKPKKKKRGN